jgi:hypothetical protein
MNEAAINTESLVDSLLEKYINLTKKDDDDS